MGGGIPIGTAAALGTLPAAAVAADNPAAGLCAAARSQFHSGQLYATNRFWEWH
jgi:hypothetical protein